MDTKINTAQSGGGKEDGGDDRTAELDPSSSVPDYDGPTEVMSRSPLEGDDDSAEEPDTQGNTIILVDSERKWDFGANQALWATISDLGTLNLEKMGDPDAAITSIQRRAKGKVIIVLILGTQNTITSSGILQVIQAATGRGIKTVLLPTDTPEDSDVEEFKRSIKAKLLSTKRPSAIIKAHDITSALGPIKEEIREAIKQTAPKT